MKVIKQVKYYWKGRMHWDLIYGSHLKNEKETKAPITPSQFGLIGYINNSYARHPENKKSVMRYW